MSQVIHIDAETHARLKAYCAEHGIPMSWLVERLIDSAIVEAAPAPAETKDEDEERIDAQPVARKERPPRAPSNAADDILARPPFWEESDR